MLLSPSMSLSSSSATALAVSLVLVDFCNVTVSGFLCCHKFVSLITFIPCTGLLHSDPPSSSFPVLAVDACNVFFFLSVFIHSLLIFHLFLPPYFSAYAALPFFLVV